MEESASARGAILCLGEVSVWVDVACEEGVTGGVLGRSERCERRERDVVC